MKILILLLVCSSALSIPLKDGSEATPSFIQKVLDANPMENDLNFDENNEIYNEEIPLYKNNDTPAMEKETVESTVLEVKEETPTPNEEESFKEPANQNLEHIGDLTEPEVKVEENVKPTRDITVPEVKEELMQTPKEDKLIKEPTMEILQDDKVLIETAKETSDRAATAEVGDISFQPVLKEMEFKPKLETAEELQKENPSENVEILYDQPIVPPKLNMELPNLEENNNPIEASKEIVSVNLEKSNNFDEAFTPVDEEESNFKNVNEEFEENYETVPFKEIIMPDANNNKQNSFFGVLPIAPNNFGVDIHQNPLEMEPPTIIDYENYEPIAPMYENIDYEDELLEPSITSVVDDDYPIQNEDMNPLNSEIFHMDDDYPIQNEDMNPLNSEKLPIDDDYPIQNEDMNPLNSEIFPMDDDYPIQNEYINPLNSEILPIDDDYPIQNEDMNPLNSEILPMNDLLEPLPEDYDDTPHIMNGESSIPSDNMPMTNEEIDSLPIWESNNFENRHFPQYDPIFDTDTSPNMFEDELYENRDHLTIGSSYSNYDYPHDEGYAGPPGKFIGNTPYNPMLDADSVRSQDNAEHNYPSNYDGYQFRYKNSMMPFNLLANLNADSYSPMFDESDRVYYDSLNSENYMGEGDVYDKSKSMIPDSSLNHRTMYPKKSMSPNIQEDQTSNPSYYPKYRNFPKQSWNNNEGFQTNQPRNNYMNYYSPDMKNKSPTSSPDYFPMNEFTYYNEYYPMSNGYQSYNSQMSENQPIDMFSSIIFQHLMDSISSKPYHPNGPLIIILDPVVDYEGEKNAFPKNSQTKPHETPNLEDNSETTPKTRTENQENEEPTVNQHSEGISLDEYPYNTKYPYAVNYHPALAPKFSIGYLDHIEEPNFDINEMRKQSSGPYHIRMKHSNTPVNSENENNFSPSYNVPQYQTMYEHYLQSRRPYFQRQDYYGNENNNQYPEAYLERTQW